MSACARRSIMHLACTQHAQRQATLAWVLIDLRDGQKRLEERLTRLLEERGVTVIPDFIANPGGAIAAYVELVSEVDDDENAKTRAKVTEAKEFTERTVADNVRQAMGLADEAGVDLTRAGLYISYQRVFGES